MGRTLLHEVYNGYSAEQLDNALLTIQAPSQPGYYDVAGILEVMGQLPEENTLGWSQVSDYFSLQQFTSFWWPMVPMAIRSIPICTAAIYMLF